MGSRSRARARAKASQPLTPAAQQSQGPSPAQARAPGPSPSTGPPQAPPWPVLAVAVVEVAEAVGLLVAAVLAGIATARGQSYQTGSGVAITLIALGGAVLLALTARGLRRARRWSRTPALLTQLFLGLVAYYLLQSGRLDWGIPAMVFAVVGVCALLAPASIEALTPGRVQKD